MRGNNIGDVDAGEKSVTKYGRQTKRNAEYTRNGLRNATTKNLCASSFFFVYTLIHASGILLH